MANTSPKANTPEVEEVPIPRIAIHNAVSGETEEREMNEDEHAAYLAQQQRYLDMAAEEQEAAEQRQAILNKLGITLEEFNLITRPTNPIV